MSDNIRVCCRFRPPNKIELKSKGHKLVTKVASDCRTVTCGSGKKEKRFTLDYIFPSDSTQETVFNYSVLPMVDSVMAGYNCTLFAYGQTGSGKTYSMEGIIDGNDRTHEGLIPRMVREVFHRILNNDEDSIEFEYTIRVSFVEIYNEKLKDLLNPGGKELKIREKQTGSRGVYIENVHAPFVASPEEVFDLLENGHVNRSVACTRMNATSSRSHAVFILRIDARNTETGSSKSSKLMMVDLAGSEKVKKTHASGRYNDNLHCIELPKNTLKKHKKYIFIEGSTLKEAKQINKSLMVLGLVINSLVENKKHVPYRDSKLTRLLSDALGGNSKTCLLITASPSRYNADETVSTLRFGTRAKSIKNEAKINQELSVSEYKKLLDKAKKREEVLKSQIRDLQNKNAALMQKCQNADIDLSDLSMMDSSNDSNDANKRFQHNANQNTTALTTLIPDSHRNTEKNDKLISDLQAKLDAINDEKVSLNAKLRKKSEEWSDAQLELKECHSHIEELRNSNSVINKRYEELHAAKAHLDKLFQSLNTGTDANASRFNTEKLQWNEDKMQFLEDIRLREQKIEDLKVTNEENMKIIKELKMKQMQQQIEQNEDDDHKENYDKEQMIAIVDTARKYKSQNEKNSAEIIKLREKLKAYKRRDEVNKQLRDNWNKQLNQMEQAVLLANEIYNRERSRHEAEMAEKDVEIMKLRKFLLSFTNRQAKITKSVTRNGQSLTTPNGHSNSTKYHGPGAARKSKIVKPKVIKTGNRNRRRVRMKSNHERKNDD